jgi:hypothetical protein
MYLPAHRPTYSTQVDTMANVINRINPAFTLHYCYHMLSHMNTASFLWLGNLPLWRLAELVRCNDMPPAWVPQSFLVEMQIVANAYGTQEG